MSSSYGTNSAKGGQRNAAPGPNLNGTSYVINSNQFLKNNGEEIAMGSKHHSAFINGSLN
jgi:hypothetical protein